MDKMMIKHLIFEMGSVTSKILIETIVFFRKTITYLSSNDHLVSNNPLFSIVIALYSLILLYFPRIFLEVIFSPVLISTGILLSTLLRLGSIQRTTTTTTTTLIEEENHHLLDEDLDHNWVINEEEDETEMGFSPKKFFVEWNVRAPLEVIYEEYEGQEDEDEENGEMGISGLGSLGRYYPESDTGSSSDGDFPGTDQGWNSPENMCFRWEEEDKEVGLIEIELNDDDYKRNKEDCDDDDDGDDDHEFLQVEAEENLIEIEISPFGSPTNKWKEFQQLHQRGSDSVNSD